MDFCISVIALSSCTITAVITHYGYARQDRKAAAREPITAKLVANLITTAGITRVMTSCLVEAPRMSQVRGQRAAGARRLPIVRHLALRGSLGLGRPTLHLGLARAGPGPTCAPARTSWPARRRAPTWR